MNKYEEKGGWFWFGFAFAWVYAAYKTPYLFEGMAFALAACTYFIISKLERISNALRDHINGEDSR